MSLRIIGNLNELIGWCLWTRLAEYAFSVHFFLCAFLPLSSSWTYHWVKRCCCLSLVIYGTLNQDSCQPLGRNPTGSGSSALRHSSTSLVRLFKMFSIPSTKRVSCIHFLSFSPLLAWIILKRLNTYILPFLFSFLYESILSSLTIGLIANSTSPSFLLPHILSRHSKAKG